MTNSQNSAQFADLISLLGDLKSFLTDFRRRLLEQGVAIETIQLATECKNYTSGPLVEVWLEQEVGPDQSFVRWMDLQPVDSHWLVSGQVLLNGEDVLFETGEFRADSLQELREKATGTLTALLEFSYPHPSDPKEAHTEIL